MKNIKRMLILGLAMQAVACSQGGTAALNNVNARYTAEEPTVEAVGESSNTPLALEIVNIQSVMVELRP